MPPVCMASENAWMNCEGRLLLSQTACVFLFPNVREPALVSPVGGVDFKSLTEQGASRQSLCLHKWSLKWVIAQHCSPCSCWESGLVLRLLTFGSEREQSVWVAGEADGPGEAMTSAGSLQTQGWHSPRPSPLTLTPFSPQPPSCCRSGGARWSPASTARSARCCPTSQAGAAVAATK